MNARGGYAPFIDGLRAVAVLAVVAYHFDPLLLPGGFAGVDIFFVISGFVVSASVAEFRGGLAGFFGFFYARRLFRIAPALILCLVVTSLVFALLVPAAWLSGSNQQTGLAAFYGFSNFVLARTGNDYFSPRVDFNPFTHTWSLAVEEQFYLIFPWVFAAYLARWRLVAAAVVAVAGVASLVYARALGASAPEVAFYLLATRFWELGAGVLLFMAMPALAVFRGGRRRAMEIVAGFCLAVLAAGLVLARPSSTPYPGGILPVAGALGVLGCLYGGETGFFARVLSLGPVRYVGKISYSLYLWHWPVLVLLRWTFGAEGWFAVAGVAAAAGLASLSYHVVETPPRRFLKASAWPKPRLIAAGVAALAVGYGVSDAAWAAEKTISVSAVMRHAVDWYPDAAFDDPARPGCRIAASKFRLGAGLAWTYRRAGCAAPAGRPMAIYVIGDSHAAAYLAMLKQVVLQTGDQVTVYGVGGCSFIGLLDVPAPDCAAFGRAAVADVVAQARPGDVVFLPSLRLPRIVDQYVVYGLAAAQARVGVSAPAVAQAVPVLRVLAGTGAKVLLEAPTPEFAAPAFRCADWYDRGNPICAGGSTMPRRTILAMRAPVMAAFGTIMAQVPGVGVWDPLPVLCPGAVCSEYDGDEPLFFDGDHLSGYAGRKLAPGFLERSKRSLF